MLLAQIKQDQLSARKNKETVKSSLLTTLIGDIENLIKTKNSDNTDTLIIGLIKSYLDKNLEFQNLHNKNVVFLSIDILTWDHFVHRYFLIHNIL